MRTIRLSGCSNPVLIDSIIWLNGEGSYTRVYCQDNTILMVSQPLVWFEHHLDFIRASRSVIVNPMYVSTFELTGSRSGRIHLLNNKVISVSRNRLKYVSAMLTSRPGSSPS